jgi:type II secretory pathway pseudopilin PulG
LFGNNTVIIIVGILAAIAVPTFLAQGTTRVRQPRRAT